jgi:hypothetical protein
VTTTVTTNGAGVEAPEDILTGARETWEQLRAW